MGDPDVSGDYEEIVMWGGGAESCVFFSLFPSVLRLGLHICGCGF